jgi:hypothetical protein
MKARTTAVLSAFIFLTVFGVTAAKADTITFASTGAGQSNSMGATIAVTPDAAWLNAIPGSSWVSFAATGNTKGAGFVEVPNGTTVSFYDSFTLAGQATSGTLTIMADDTATILLNGVALATATQPSGTTPSCWAFSSGCLSPTTISLPTNLLQAGVNTLTFEVEQLGGASFGLDYLGSVVDPPVNASEPAAGLMLAVGLLGLAALSVRRQMFES